MTTPSIYIQPDIRRGRITLALESPETDSLSVAIPQLDITDTVQAGSNTLTFEEFDTWSFDDPKLYTLTSDTLPTVPFGMREFTIKENRFFFNNRPVFIKGLDCTTIQHTAALSDDQLNALRAFFSDIKGMGFNLLRIAVSHLTEDILTIADTLGILVELELRTSGDIDQVKKLRNHPSLVIWNALTLDIDAQALIAIDPSRLFLFTDDDTNEPYFIRPFRDDAEAIELHTLAQSNPSDHYARSYCEHLGSSSRLTYVAAIQAGALDPGQDFAAQINADIQSRDLTRIFSDVKAIGTQLRALRNASLVNRIDGLRSNPNVAGYCITAHDDSAPLPKLSETLGELISLNDVKHPQAAVRPLIHIHQHNLIPRQETPVRVHLLNELKLEGRADLSLQVVGPTNQVLWKKKRGVRIPKSGKLIWEGSIAASGSPGLHRFTVRIMQNMKRIAESTVDFYVYPESQKWDGTINLIDPNKQWTELLSDRVAHIEYKAPVHVIPPIANSIRAYPDNEIAQVLGQVHKGAVAIIFQPPKDWNDFARVIDTSLTATPIPCNTAFPAQAHYAKSHPVFDALPSRCMMTDTYADILPSTTFAEASNEDICGTFCASPANEDQTQWGHDILVVLYGSGRLVFTNMPILEQLGRNPIADHLFTNLLKHFSRRSIPSKDATIQVHHASVEWLRHERQECTQNWALIGMFPHDPEASKPEVYPPEDGIDLTATYPGWYRAVNWKIHYPTSRNHYTIDLDDALGLDTQNEASSDYGIAYAYTEVIGDTRGEVRMIPECSVPIEIFLNGSLVYSSDSNENRPQVYLKLGKNTLLVKFRKQPGPFNFRLNFEEMTTPIRYRWWKPANHTA